jgi:hypothetical protein
MSSAILSEFLDAAEAVTPAVDRAMARAGIAFMVDGLPRYGIARIRAEGGFYELCDDGVPALLAVEWHGGVNSGVVIEDIVATVFAGRGGCYRRLGSIDVLGQNAIGMARAHRSDIVVSHSPLTWLAGKCRGACLINWSADPRYVFHGIRNLRCETDQLSRRLAARIAECSLPTPFVIAPRRSYRRAA